MSKFIGRSVNIGIGREASRGAGVAPAFWLPKSTENIRDAVQKARSRLNYGTIDGGGNVAPVALKWGEGTIEFDLLNSSFGLFLYNLLGACSSAANGDNTYTHTFSLSSTAQHNSLAIHVKDTDRDLQYKNAMINSIQITIVPDDVVKVTAEIVSKGYADAVNTVSYSQEYKFVGRHLQFKVAATTADLAAASLIKPKRLVLNISQNVIRDNNAGTVQPVDILNQQVEIDGEIELNHEDDTYRDLMLNGSYRAMRIYLVNSNETIGSGSQNPEFRLDLSRVDFEGWEPVRANDEIARQTLNFMALYDISNGNVINNCALINTTASY